MLARRKRKVFNIEEKSRILQKLKDGEPNGSIAREFGITHSTVSCIWRDRKKIWKYLETKSLKTKRAKSSFHTDIEDALVKWIKEQRAAAMPVTTRLLIEKAEAMAKDLGKNNYKCTSSWIQRFRRRHDLTGIRVPRVMETSTSRYGEEILPQDCPTHEWLPQDKLADEWLTLCEGYQPDDIFNADETGLYYNMTPEKTSKYKLEPCTYGKLCRSRLTLMVAANMTGNCKHTLLVIGSKKLDLESHHHLPANYEYNYKSWMTPIIFERWIRKWDRQLRINDRKIILLVDRSPIHPVIEDLYCIKIVRLPIHIPAVLQPMAQGVKTALKAQYRKLQVLHTLQCIEKGGTGGLTLFDAILTLEEAWNNVPQKAIADSFHYAGFKNLSIISTPYHDHNQEALPSGRPPLFNESRVNTERVTLFRLIQALGSTLTLSQLEEYIDVDNNLRICATSKKDRLQDAKENELAPVEQEKVKLPSLNDALEAVGILHKFLLFNPEFSNVNQEIVLGQMRHQLLYAYTKHQCNKVKQTMQ